MSTVKVPFGGKTSDTAVLLLAAAEELDLPGTVIGTTTGAFLVPQEVYDRAFPAPKPVAKKAAVKSSTPKKAQE